MQYVIEQEDSHGGKFHWVVKCVEKGRIVALHRFYQSLENFVYHRGEHDEHELPAYEAITEHLRQHPELKQEAPECPRNIVK